MIFIIFMLLFYTLYMILFIILFIIFVIPLWQIFNKAGESGWKSLIPLYNLYIVYKIGGGVKYNFKKMIATMLILFILFVIFGSIYLIIFIFTLGIGEENIPFLVKILAAIINPKNIMFIGILYLWYLFLKIYINIGKVFEKYKLFFISSILIIILYVMSNTSIGKFIGISNALGDYSSFLLCVAFFLPLFMVAFGKSTYNNPNINNTDNQNNQLNTDKNTIIDNTINQNLNTNINNNTDSNIDHNGNQSNINHTIVILILVILVPFLLIVLHKYFPNQFRTYYNLLNYPNHIISNYIVEIIKR